MEAPPFVLLDPEALFRQHPRVWLMASVLLAVWTSALAAHLLVAIFLVVVAALAGDLLCMMILIILACVACLRLHFCG